MRIRIAIFGLGRIIKPVFGLPLYTYCLLAGHIPRGERSGPALEITLGWLSVTILTLVCITAPAGHDRDNIVLMTIVLTPSVSALIYWMAEHCIRPSPQ